MAPKRPSRRAVVLGAALNSWTKTTHDPGEHVARLVIRQAPDWEHVGTANLTDPQLARLLDILRTDLIPARPNTPLQAAAAVDQILAEWHAAGRSVIRPADLVDQLPRIGQSRTWLAGHLVTLTDQGYLRETRRPGVYRLAR